MRSHSSITRDNTGREAEARCYLSVCCERRREMSTERTAREGMSVRKPQDCIQGSWRGDLVFILDYKHYQLAAALVGETEKQREGESAPKGTSACARAHTHTIDQEHSWFSAHKFQNMVCFL